MSNMKKRRFWQLASVLCLVMSLAAGCGKTAEPTVTAAATTTTAGELAAGDKAKPEDDKAEVSESPVSSGEEKADEGEATREITDMAGRTMEVPVEIDKVFSTGPVAAIYLYTMDPDRMLGWNYDLNDLEKKIILPEYHDLPSFGMGDSVNYEAVIAAAPQIALDVSSGNEASKEEADRLSESLGIPVVIVSSQMEDTAEVYRFLGELFGDPQRGELLAAYVDKTLKDVTGAGIPDDQKVTVYYGNGENSLETAPAGSTHSQIIDFVNAVNVADMEVEGGSRVQISAEQLLAWDPDYIIVNGEPKKDISGEDAVKAVLETPEFATLKAVQNQQVYGTPNTPFSWVDRPPGPNRIIGIRWLAKILYPDVFDYDVDQEVKEFYKLFYHVELTEEQMSGFLGL